MNESEPQLDKLSYAKNLDLSGGLEVVQPRSQQVGRSSAKINDLRAPTWQEIQQAYQFIAASELPRTKIVQLMLLNELSGGADISIASEHIQVTHSFKIRAALFELSDLPPGTQVVLASSGNQALAFAHVAKRRGISLITVLPESAPAFKVDVTRAHGAIVIRHGSTYDQAYRYARCYAEQYGARFIDVSSPRSVAALSTVVWEMLEQVPHADALILPAGGGTLLAGGAWVAKEYAKERGREILVIGAVPEGAATTYESFKARELVTVNNPDTIADGAKVETTDKHLFPLILEHVDDIVQVPDARIKLTMLWLKVLTGECVEGAGALCVAAIMGGQGVLKGARSKEIDLRGKTVLTVITGGNVDQSTLNALKCEIIYNLAATQFVIS